VLVRGRRDGLLRPAARAPRRAGPFARQQLPHYDGEAERRPTYRRAVAEGLPAGIAADDCCALHFAGTELVETVSSRPAAQAYRVEVGSEGVVETPIAARYLGA
jgi:dipeptidase E